MELRYLKTFQKVATLASFSRAAENLHFAQSTVSAHIKSLEDELGIPLFDRLGRQIILTSAGELLLNQSKRLLAIEEETLAEITSLSDPKGSLTLRVPQTISTCFLPPVLANFQNEFPNVRIEIIGCTFNVERELKAGTIDLAFLLADPLDGDNLHIESLGTEPLLLVTNPLNRLAKKGSINLKDINGQTLLLSKTDCSYRKGFEKLLDEKRVNPASIMEFNSIEAVKQSVIAGAGITILPRIFVNDDIKSGRLAVLKEDSVPHETSLLMIWHKDKWISPILKAFIESARDIIGHR